MSDFDSDTGQNNNHRYSGTNPHPLHGKDPNIMNELGHTHYPKYVHKFNEKGKILESKVIENEDGEEVGWSHVWVKPAKTWSKPPIVDGK